MKKRDKRLAVNKVTIACLDDRALLHIQGGTVYSDSDTLCLEECDTAISNDVGGESLCDGQDPTHDKPTRFTDCTTAATVTT